MEGITATTLTLLVNGNLGNLFILRYALDKVTKFLLIYLFYVQNI